jgi:hypothetical protein
VGLGVFSLAAGVGDAPSEVVLDVPQEAPRTLSIEISTAAQTDLVRCERLTVPIPPIV